MKLINGSHSSSKRDDCCNKSHTTFVAGVLTIFPVGVTHSLVLHKATDLLSNVVFALWSSRCGCRN